MPEDRHGSLVYCQNNNQEAIYLITGPMWVGSAFVRLNQFRSKEPHGRIFSWNEGRLDISLLREEHFGVPVKYT
jgi:hypothetical protein